MTVSTFDSRRQQTEDKVAKLQGSVDVWSSYLDFLGVVDLVDDQVVGLDIQRGEGRLGNLLASTSSKIVDTNHFKRKWGSQVIASGGTGR